MLLEKLGILASVALVGVASGAGYIATWDTTPATTIRPASAERAPVLAPGLHGYGNATPMPSPTVSPTTAAVPATKPRARRVAQLTPLPPGGVAPGGGGLLASSPDPLDPTFAGPTTTGPTTTGPTTPGPTTGTSTSTSPTSPTQATGMGVAEFTMATFNLLGSSHTKGRSNRASGPVRMNGALQILGEHQVTVAGLQEFQPDQRAAFQSRAKGWAMYPGLSMGRRAGENSVVWRTDTWDLVTPGLIDIPYFSGNVRPMPYVLLRHKQTGIQAYFSTFHNPADVHGPAQRWRTDATTREVGLFNRLKATGIPQFVTGDMNERDNYFCRVTGEAGLVAAAGGSRTGNACRPPKPIQIDWIFGSPGVAFSGYTVDKSPLVRRTTDHPVVLAHVAIDASKFTKASVPAS